MLTLAHLVGERLLAPVRPDLIERPPRITTASPATRAVLGYLAANCGVCHNGRGEIAALGPTIRYRDLLEDGDAVAQRLVGQPTRWQLPGRPEGSSVLVEPGAPDHSALLARMRSRSPSTQMPPLGTVLRDQQAVDAITGWISGLTRGGGSGTRPATMDACLIPNPSSDPCAKSSPGSASRSCGRPQTLTPC